jgi:hypothetical protein
LYHNIFWNCSGALICIWINWWRLLRCPSSTSSHFAVWQLLFMSYISGHWSQQSFCYLFTIIIRFGTTVCKCQMNTCVFMQHQILLLTKPSIFLQLDWEPVKQTCAAIGKENVSWDIDDGPHIKRTKEERVIDCEATLDG